MKSLSRKKRRKKQLRKNNAARIQRLKAERKLNRPIERIHDSFWMTHGTHALAFNAVCKCVNRAEKKQPAAQLQSAAGHAVPRYLVCTC